MYKISLINMPFTYLGMPSIALAQLTAAVKKRFGDRVRVRTLYLNHDFVHYLGREAYELMIYEARVSGLPDWFFRQVAFSEEEDNTQQYFRRYNVGLNERLSAIKGKVLSRRMGLERFMRRLVARNRLDQEDLVGFTSMFSQNLPSIALARLIKEANPQVVTVLGGANCEAPMGAELARCVDPVDFVFCGPSLVSFPTFVGHQLEGESEECHQIRGVFSNRNADQEFLKGRGAAGDELPIEIPLSLDYDAFLEGLNQNFPGKVPNEIKTWIPFETSRGCWWGQRAHCTFCGLNGGTMAYRAMPASTALEFMQGLMDRYSDRCKHFQSVDNIMAREYLTDVFPHLKTPPGVSLFYEVKADLTTSEMEVLSKAGVTEIQPGIESLASSTLRLMKKGTTSFRNIVFLKNCVRFGINPAWNLLIGFPGEKEDVYKKYLEDLPLLPHLPPPAGAFPIRFDRYSPYFVRAEEYGLDLAPYEYYRFIYPFSQESLEQIAYHFEDRNYSSQYLSDMLAWQRKLEKAMTDWKERRQGGEGKLAAELHLKVSNGKPLVHDTRSGDLAEHDLEDLGLRILALLDERGRKLPDIARQLNVSEEKAHDQLGKLTSLGLLFEEQDRYISLVVGGQDFLEEFWGTSVVSQRAASQLSSQPQGLIALQSS